MSREHGRTTFNATQKLVKPEMMTPRSALARTMSAVRARRVLAGLSLSGLLLFASACGGDSGNDEPGAKPSESLRAAALSLQQAMNSVSREIDVMSSTRASLDRLGATLQPAISQTSDVIGLLTPKATSDGTEAQLLKGARQQRSFLQFAADATSKRTRASANSSLGRARAAGRGATSAYADVAQKQSEMAGLLPGPTTFNTGRLRDAVLKVNRGPRKTSPSPPPASSPPPPPAQAETCGDGLSVNSVTSCPFARAVRDEYESTNGASVIEVFSPVTQRSYTMSCSGGVPTVCRGGNGAVVTIR